MHMSRDTLTHVSCDRPRSYYPFMPSYWGFGDTPHVLNPRVCVV